MANLSRAIRRKASGESLELLLDTVTNTFGGILFLAMLVAVMLQSPGKPAASTEKQKNGEEPLSSLERARAEARIKLLSQEIGLLQAKLSAAQQSQANSNPVLADMTARRNELQDMVSAKLVERAATQVEIAELQEKIANVNAEIDEQDRRKQAVTQAAQEAATELTGLEAEAAKLALLRLDLEKKLQPAVIEQDATLPIIRASTKTQVSLYLRFGRLYMTHKWVNGDRRGPNTAEFIVTGKSPPVARPIPGKGKRISGASVSQYVRELAKRFPPNRFGVALIVYQDSFEIFQLLKTELVAQGYEYRLLPCKPGDRVRDSGGRGEAQ